MSNADIAKKSGNEHRCCWRVYSSCCLQDTSSKNTAMNTGALKGMKFLLLTRHIVKKTGNEHRCCWRVCSSCYLQDTSSTNLGVNTGAVVGYAVPLTYQTHRQKTREWTQVLLKGMSVVPVACKTHGVLLIIFSGKRLVGDRGKKKST